METKRRTKSILLPQARWMAYATAGAATALATAPVAEAEVHYSGPLNRPFNAPAEGSVLRSFHLDQRGDYFAMEHIRRSPDTNFGSALCSFVGIVSGGFAGFTDVFNGTVYGYASRLRAGQTISTRPFVTTASLPGYLAVGDGFGNSDSQWRAPGKGFIGFKFNNGAGAQYGWVRIKTSGSPRNRFILVDYAWGDVGDRIKAGQTSGNSQAATVAPDQGSLGLLALGAAGLLMSRNRRRPVTGAIE